jgi:hypothetical protein
MLQKFIKNAFWGVATCISLTASAQTSGTVYFSSGSPTQLYRLSNPGTPGVTATAIGSAVTTYNGMGYNNVDGNLYAINANGVVVRVNSGTGALTNLNISLPYGNNYAAGEVVGNMMYVTNMNGAQTFFRINLSTGTYTSSAIGAGIADLAYYGGFLYGYNGLTGEIYKITPATGAKVVVGSGFGTGGVGALWSDGTGIIYFDGRAVYNANTNVTLPNAGVGTGANVAGSGSGTDDGTWSPASFAFTNGGTIGYSQNNCSSFDPALISSVADPSGGSGSVEYRWWANGAVIPGAVAATYDPGTISVTTNYQREARRGNTAWVASNVVTMTIVDCNTNLTDGGTIGASQSSCNMFDPAGIASVTPPSGGTGPAAIEYRWWANGAIVPGATSATYDPGTVSVTTNYQREARRGTTAWVASNVVTMTINSAPNVVINASGGTPQCYSGALILTATGGNAYTWSTGSTADTTAVSPSATTTYTVTATDSNGCTASASQVVDAAIDGNITSNPFTDGDNRVCHDTPVMLTATGGDTYTWIGSNVTTDTTTVIATPGDDVYQVIVSRNGCSVGDTATITVYGKGCNDSAALAGAFSKDQQVRFGNTDDISFYPNPVGGQLTVEGLAGDESVIIYNALGQKLTEVKASNVSTTISFEKMNAGNYLVVVVKDGKRIKSQQIVKK